VIVIVILVMAGVFSVIPVTANFYLKAVKTSRETSEVRYATHTVRAPCAREKV
jgi:hypothetical protein